MIILPKCKLVLLAIVTIGFISSCKKEKSFQNNAEILGYDMRMCVCCGGLMVAIDGVSDSVSNPFFLTNQLPDGYRIPEDTKFPLLVKIDWQKNVESCGGNRFIKILRIANR